MAHFSKARWQAIATNVAGAGVMLLGLFAASCQQNEGDKEAPGENLGTTVQALGNSSYVPANYGCIWHDEFGGDLDQGQAQSAINESYWTMEGTNVNNELQAYTRRQCTTHPSNWNLCVQQGKLTIRGTQDDLNCSDGGDADNQPDNADCALDWNANVGAKSYTSGRLNSKHKVKHQYGYIEFRARLPFQGVTPQSGLWPAIWLLGNNINEGLPPGDTAWPWCGEFDMMEYTSWNNHMGYNALWIGDDNNLDACSDWPEGGEDECGPCSGGSCTGVQQNGSKYRWAGYSNFPHNGWHTYGFLWNSSSMNVFIDGDKRSTLNLSSSETEFQQQMFIIMNLAIGGDLGKNVEISQANWDNQKVALDVDYVRWYQQGAADACGLSTACTPQCSGKQCGPDGCGGTCGTCSGNTSCSSGQCVCTPQCSGKVCGDNGCGGTCGTCGSGQQCNASGSCVTAIGKLDAVFLEAENGTMTGSPTWTEVSEDAASNDQYITATSTTTGSSPGPNRASYQVGLNAGSYRFWIRARASASGGYDNNDSLFFRIAELNSGAWTTFNNNTEMVSWTWKNTGATYTVPTGGGIYTVELGNREDGFHIDQLYITKLGDDPNAGSTPPCTPDCTNSSGGAQECGPDSCGGVCGTCLSGEICNSSGMCDPSCTPSCSGKQCGNDGCGGSCGACPTGYSCDTAGQCVAPSSSSEQVVIKTNRNGMFVQRDGTSSLLKWTTSSQSSAEKFERIPTTGSRFKLKSVGNGKYVRVNTGSNDDLYATASTLAEGSEFEAPTCDTLNAFRTVSGDDDASNYVCADDPNTGLRSRSGGCQGWERFSFITVTQCNPSCTGKACGGDGCGGTCPNTCGSGTVCDATNNQCVDAGCTPNCSGMQCGSDGCGSTCGTCGSNQACNAGLCVCTPNCTGKACGSDGCGGSCGTCGTGTVCDGAGVCVTAVCASNNLTVAGGTGSTNLQSGNGAIDNNTGTRWESNHNIDPSWLRIDLGSTKQVNRVRIDWEAANAKNYSVQISDDPNFGSYTTLVSKSNMPTGQHRIDDLTNLNGQGRYVRIYGTARNLTYGYSIWEVDVYGDNNPLCDGQ